MKRDRLLLVFLLIIFLPSLLFTQDQENRGLKAVVERLDMNAKVGRQYLFVIGIGKYEYWNPLKNPAEDAQEVKHILVSRYYIDEVHELYDEQATKVNILKKFDELKNKLKPDDSLLIFYAGHGYEDKKTNTGFWIPVNAGTDVYEQANWLPHSQIRGIISNFEAIHICLISDSCFSGDILDSMRGRNPVTIDNDSFKHGYSLVSRLVLTSGSFETVPDDSAFNRELKLMLKKNSSPYIDIEMLYYEIRLGVKSTTPRFGNLKDSGHQDGASFLLFLKKDSPDTVVVENPKKDSPESQKALTTGEAEDTEKKEENAGSAVEIKPGFGEKKTSEQGAMGFTVAISGAYTSPVASIFKDLFSPSASFDLMLTYRCIDLDVVNFSLVLDEAYFNHAKAAAYSYYDKLDVVNNSLGIEADYSLPFFKQVSLSLAVLSGLGISAFRNDHFNQTDTVFGLSLSGRAAIGYRMFDRFIFYVEAAYIALIYSSDASSWLTEFSFGGGIGYRF